MAAFGPTDSIDLSFPIKFSPELPSPESPSSPAASLAEKKNHKVQQDFIKIFGALKPTEMVLVETGASLKKDNLLQPGIFFLSSQRFGFWAKILGTTVKVLHTLDDIKQVLKKRHGLIHNSLQIEMRSGESYRFTSFLQRDSVYTLLSTFLPAGEVKEIQEKEQESDSTILQPPPPTPLPPMAIRKKEESKNVQNILILLLLVLVLNQIFLYSIFNAQSALTKSLLTLLD